MRGLVISWDYLPGNSSEALVTYKLLRNSGFEYDVFTRKSHGASMYDRQTDESELSASNVTTYFAGTNNPSKWMSEVVQFYEQYRDKYDFIMSRSMPAETHAAAVRIKELHPEVFWIASFSDPMVNSPFLKVPERSENPWNRKNLYSGAEEQPTEEERRLAKRYNQAQKVLWDEERKRKLRDLEFFEQTHRETLEQADAVIMNNIYEAKAAFIGDLAQYNTKCEIVPHAFDLELYPEAKEKTDEKTHFVYVGHLDETRNAKAVLEAIKILKERNSEVAGRLSCDFYGHMDAAEKLRVLDEDLTDIVKVHPNVGYQESLGIIAGADYLLLIDADFSREMSEYIFFPGKLVDYLGSGREILAVTQVRGATRDVIETTGAGKAVRHEPEEIYQAILEWMSGEHEKEVRNEEAIREYDAKEVARNFDEMVARRMQK